MDPALPLPCSTVQPVRLNSEYEGLHLGISIPKLMGPSKPRAKAKLEVVLLRSCWKLEATEVEIMGSPKNPLIYWGRVATDFA